MIENDKEVEVTGRKTEGRRNKRIISEMKYEERKKKQQWQK